MFYIYIMSTTLFSLQKSSPLLNLWWSYYIQLSDPLITLAQHIIKSSFFESFWDISELIKGASLIQFFSRTLEIALQWGHLIFLFLQVGYNIVEMPSTKLSFIIQYFIQYIFQSIKVFCTYIFKALLSILGLISPSSVTDLTLTDSSFLS